MIQTRLTVTLLREERSALAQLAERERREPRAQAAVLIRQALEKLGLLQPATPGNNQQGEAQHEPTA